MKHRINMAAGTEPVDILITNARVVDVFSGLVRQDSVAIGDGVFLGFGQREAREVVDAQGAYLLPGFIDAHIHLESSMVTPARFAEMALPHGTTSVVADPHELANVCGTAALRFLLASAQTLPLSIFLALPSCVPATPFEDSGAVLKAEDLAPFMDDPHVASLGEMMNYPGVLSGDPEVLEKLALSRSRRKPVDGHAPALLGRELDAYLCTALPIRTSAPQLKNFTRTSCAAAASFCETAPQRATCLRWPHWSRPATATAAPSAATTVTPPNSLLRGIWTKCCARPWPWAWTPSRQCVCVPSTPPRPRDWQARGPLPPAMTPTACWLTIWHPSTCA